MKGKGVRDLAFAHKKDGKPTKEIVAMLKVSQRTIQLWFKQGPIQSVRKVERVKRRTLSPLQEEGVLAFVEAQPDAVLADIIDFVSTPYCVHVSCD